jgi:hypothetical protein
MPTKIIFLDIDGVILPLGAEAEQFDQAAPDPLLDEEA